MLSIVGNIESSFGRKIMYFLFATDVVSALLYWITIYLKSRRTMGKKKFRILFCSKTE